jgi:hypothetical protein
VLGGLIAMNGTTTPLAPSRRAVMRTAAWSVPVISVAATAPAFAASPQSTVTWGTPVKWGSGQQKNVSWDLSLSAGTREIDEVAITFTYTPAGNGSFEAQTFVIRTAGQLSDGTWRKTPSAGQTSTITARRTTNIAAGSNTLLHVNFTGGDNSSGTVSASIVITYVGGDTTTVNTGNVAWVATSGPAADNPHPGH